jgi:Tfp pilus assembly protein PilN
MTKGIPMSFGLKTLVLACALAATTIVARSQGAFSPRDQIVAQVGYLQAQIDALQGQLQGLEAKKQSLLGQLQAMDAANAKPKAETNKIESKKGGPRR